MVQHSGPAILINAAILERSNRFVASSLGSARGSPPSDEIRHPTAPRPVRSSGTQNLDSTKSTPSPIGARRWFGTTSNRIKFPTIRCTTEITPASAARIARAPFRSAKTRVPAAGQASTKPNADCTHAKAQVDEIHALLCTIPLVIVSVVRRSRTESKDPFGGMGGYLTIYP